MKSKDITDVEIEARRLLQRIKEYRKRHAETDHPYPSSEGGALRRASLDLTRSLARMRKPQNWDRPA